ncbi:hypothetical protein ACFFX0_32490 [Citricoccus parietis]|uniref:Uncharacterized protein n=1 Tax=Citricoccus parietis TaxID=592307 RepID=A0ABV5G9N3_9MICC
MPSGNAGITGHPGVDGLTGHVRCALFDSEGALLALLAPLVSRH